jgi:probable phosphoglycerate mutase
LSDLFCAATLVVARHGQAAYDVPDVASDDGGWLTPEGRRQARALGESLRDRRIASVWCSDMTRAVQTAEIAAGVLGGPPVTVKRGLREFAVGDLAGRPLTDLDPTFAAWVGGDLSGGCPGAETGEQVLDRLRSELESAADEHRGETVLVVSHGGAISVALPRLCVNVPADYALRRPIANAATAEVAVDADGWVLRSWNSQPL